MKNNLFDLLERASPTFTARGAFVGRDFAGFAGLIGRLRQIPTAIDDRTSLGGLAQVLGEVGGLASGIARLRAMDSELNDLRQRVANLEHR